MGVEVVTQPEQGRKRGVDGRLGRPRRGPDRWLLHAVASEQYLSDSPGTTTAGVPGSGGLTPSSPRQSHNFTYLGLIIGRRPETPHYEQLFV